jgi:hypothetical protein
MWSNHGHPEISSMLRSDKPRFKLCMYEEEGDVAEGGRKMYQMQRGGDSNHKEKPTIEPH